MPTVELPLHAKLYRADYGTFEEYCREKWGWEKAYCNHLVRAAQTVKGLPEKSATIVATESQARELAKVEPEKSTSPASPPWPS